ncbi:Sodium, potassium, lithium and rubidium/H(+) antiporter [Xylophilus ampelinus]|nr:Na+/H+ antiporter [Variovorax sp.]VTY40247.1 Sodium, potassium, lithium and rubidium/H(+) antiporter [Xylophilus ampelinus]
MHTVETVLLVLMLGALTGIAARYLRAIPLPLIQIALGALLSWPQQGLHIAFDPELFLLLFIPPLLFADGWRIPKREFFALYRPILRLAFGLVLFTVLGLGYLIHWLIPEMPLTVAFALAAVVSPTDAVAVSAITRNLGMPAKTMHILEGESLLNDASGLVALKFAIAATLTGLFSWAGVAREFLWIALGGLGVGALLGWGFARARATVTRRLGDVATTQMVLLLVLLPFAAYIVGERIGVSGILAAVAAGITTNFADLERGEFVAERMQTEGTWAMIESAFNGAIFLLLGLQLPSILGTMLDAGRHDSWQLAGYVVAMSTALLVLRWIWLTLAMQGSLLKAHVEGKMAERPSWLLTLATTLAGIRGAVTLAGALSVPLMVDGHTPFPARDLLVFLAAGTILFTLVVGSVGLPLVLRRLPAPAEPAEVHEERHARLTACRAAIASMALGPAQTEGADPAWLAQYQEAAGRLAQDYRKRIDLLDDAATPTTPEAQAESPEAVRQRRQRYLVELELRLSCLRVERDTLYAERHAHHINDESLRSLVGELDLSEISLRKRLRVARAAAGLPVDG